MTAKGLTALQYYRYMRRICKYSPRTAICSTMMRYTSKDDYYRRLKLVAKILNRNDQSKKG